MKTFNLKNEHSIKEAKEKLDRYIFAEKMIEIKEVKKTRSATQNSALHKFYEILASQMIELGMEYHYTGLKGSDLTMMWTANLVKEFVWKPIQFSLFNIKSTTKINTQQINQILDVLTKHFGELGVPITFPNKFDAYLKQLENNN